MIAVHVEEPNAIDLARLDDDGGASRAALGQAARHDGARQRSEDRVALPLTVESTPRARDDRFTAPMIPGAREPGMLTTFGVHAVVIPASPSTMDAATIAAREREGGGAPNQRRRPGQGSAWSDLRRRLRRSLIGD